MIIRLMAMLAIINNLVFLHNNPNTQLKNVVTVSLGKYEDNLNIANE